jgi:phospholipid transport system substrate-binding protein
MSVSSPDRRAILRLMLSTTALGVGWGRAAIASEITAPVEQLHAGLMAIMKAGKTASFRQRYETIAPVIGRTFDLEAILRQVIGPRSAWLPSDQQAALADAFRRYTIASYVANFDSYLGQRFEIAPAVRAVGNDRVVETRIASPVGRGHELDYVLRVAGGRWSTCSPMAPSAVWPRSAPKCAPCLPTAAAPGCWSVCGRRPLNCRAAFSSSHSDCAPAVTCPQRTWERLPRRADLPI